MNYTNRKAWNLVSGMFTVHRTRWQPFYGRRGLPTGMMRVGWASSSFPFSHRKSWYRLLTSNSLESNSPRDVCRRKQQTSNARPGHAAASPDTRAQRASLHSCSARGRGREASSPRGRQESKPHARVSDPHGESVCEAPLPPTGAATHGRVRPALRLKHASLLRRSGFRTGGKSCQCCLGEN